MSMTVDRVVDATSGITRSQLLGYYQAVADLMMPHLQGRPVAFLRAPEDIETGMFFQKHMANLRLPGVAQFNSALYATQGPLLEVREPLGVLSAAQANVIEFHTFNTTTHPGEHPDRVSFELDPGDGVDWPAVCEAALRLRDVLHAVGLACWPKTSGGRGLHVLVPLAPALHSCEAARHFSEALAQRLAQEEPSRFVAASGPRNRVGRIFIDYLRNGPGATTVAAWSACARPGMPISVPLAWSELPGLRSPTQWTVAKCAERIATGNRPWGDYWLCRQNLHQLVDRLAPVERRTT